MEWCQETKFSAVKYGWIKISLHYILDDHDINYLMDCLDFISELGSKFLNFYLFDPMTGTWTHKNESTLKNINKINLKLLLRPIFQAKSDEDRNRLFKLQLKEAKQLFGNKKIQIINSQETILYSYPQFYFFMRRIICK